MDVIAVSEAVSEAVSRARRGDGPTFIVCDTYRYMGHFEGDEQTYRTKQDVDEWRTKDPILRLKDTMVREGALTDKEFDDLNASILTEIDDAGALAEKSEWPG